MMVMMFSDKEGCNNDSADVRPPNKIGLTCLCIQLPPLSILRHGKCSLVGLACLCLTQL